MDDLSDRPTRRACLAYRKRSALLSGYQRRIPILAGDMQTSDGDALFDEKPSGHERHKIGALFRTNHQAPPERWNLRWQTIDLLEVLECHSDLLPGTV